MRAFVPVAVVIALIAPGVVRAEASGDPASSCFLVRTGAQLRNGGSASGNGTGFLVDRDLVLTCNHLLRIPTPIGIVTAQTVKVETANKQALNAKVVARDIDHDLALLQLQTPVADCAPLAIEPFALRTRDSVHIIGHFPDQVRTTRGNLITPTAMQGFALSSAKVYSGFSGGPILDQNDIVQGILSQRDDANNSIFVRSEVLINMLSSYAKRNNRNIASLETQPEVASAPAEVQQSAKPVLTATATKSIKSARAEDNEVVVAIPVRKAATHYTSQTAR